MIPQWLKSLFTRHPPLCASCAKRDLQISFSTIPGQWTAPVTRHALEPFCGEKVAGFPYRRDCKQYQYALFYGDVEQENKQ